MIMKLLCAPNNKLNIGMIRDLSGGLFKIKFTVVIVTMSEFYWNCAVLQYCLPVL